MGLMSILLLIVYGVFSFFMIAAYCSTNKCDHEKVNDNSNSKNTIDNSTTMNTAIATSVMCSNAALYNVL